MTLVLFAIFDPFTWFAIGAALLGGAAVIALAWNAVCGWLDPYRNSGNTAVLLKERLESGKYSVVAGVFSGGGTQIAVNSWEVDELDAELVTAFGNADTIHSAI